MRTGRVARYWMDCVPTSRRRNARAICIWVSSLAPSLLPPPPPPRVADPVPACPPGRPFPLEDPCFRHGGSCHRLTSCVNVTNRRIAWEASCNDFEDEGIDDFHSALVNVNVTVI